MKLIKFMFLYRLEAFNIIMASFILYSLIPLLFSAIISLNSGPQNGIAIFINTMSKIKKYISNQKVVGYVTEHGSNFDLNQPMYLKEYYLTQYSLAPIIIQDDTKPDYIIGNFHTNKDLKFSNNIKIIKKFSNGLLLLKYK